MTHKVFVYGTLKRGYGNNQVLGNSPCVGVGKTMKPYDLVCLGPFPAMLETSQRNLPVLGEVYEVNTDTLQRLDWLEGNGSLYQRKLIDVEGHKNVWAYFFMRETRVPAYQGRVASTEYFQQWR